MPGESFVGRGIIISLQPPLQEELLFLGQKFRGFRVVSNEEVAGSGNDYG